MNTIRERATQLAAAGAPAALAVRAWDTLVASVAPYWGQVQAPPTLKRSEVMHMHNRLLRLPPDTVTLSFLARMVDYGLNTPKLLALGALLQRRDVLTALCRTGT